jgi:hypothetical protein
MRWVLAALFCLSSFAQAEALLRDVGVIGLMSHDIFAWDHKREVNTENGRLDLSTIFDYDGGSRLWSAGNPKNSENAPVYTVAMNLVDFYRARLNAGDSSLNARRAAVVHFLSEVEDSYSRLMGEKLPAVASREMPNNLEQASLRALHDILPGRIALYDRYFDSELDLTNLWWAKTRLTEKELDQPLKPFDGDYDLEFRQISIPFTGVVVDLKKADRKFIEKFTPYKQADLLAELARVGRGEISIQQVSFAGHLKDLFTKALCAEGNPYMPQDRPCL